MKSGLVAGIVWAGLAAGAWAAVTLTDVHGREATVELIAVSSEEIEFRLNGEPGKMPLVQLDSDSREEAIAAAKSAGIYETHPPLSVQIGVGTKRRNDEKSWYRKIMKITPSLSLAGESRLAPIPALEATVVVVTMDTRKKYVDQENVYEVLLNETIDIPAAGSGKRRLFDFTSKTVTFDTARDTSNVGGQDYKYFVFALRDPETKRVVDFQTNCPALEKLVASQPDQLEKYLGLKVGAPFVDPY